MATVKVIRSELIRLFDVLERSRSKTFNRKLAYALSRTKQFWSSEITAFSKFQQPSDEFVEYEKKRMELLEKYGKKDKEGNLVVVQNGRVSFGATRDKEMFDVAMNLLEEEYKDCIDNRNGQIKEVSEMLMDEVEVAVYQIPFEMIPEEVDFELMEVLTLMIKEEDVVIGDMIDKNESGKGVLSN